ncbi:ATP-binding protein [bacterium]|nr:ATP-binding protein [bacterium]
MQIDYVATPTLLVPADLSDDAVTRFDRGLKELLTEDPLSIAFDASQLEQVTSSHIKLLWQAYHVCLDAGATMKLKSLSPGLERVLKVLDLYELLAENHESICPQLRKAVRIKPGAIPPPYADEFPADSHSIDKALEGFLKFLRRFTLPEVVIFELRIVFYELATNIGSHAQMRDDDLVVFSALVEGSKLIMVFADSGVPFDPRSSTADYDPRTASKNGQTRGFGLTLVQRLTDKMSYVRMNDAINVLTIEKMWD